MSTEENKSYLDLDNKKIGQKIYIQRKIKGLKAFDVAERLGIKEAAYTKYERGETKITIEFVRKVSEILDIDPLLLLSSSDINYFDNIHNSPIMSTFHTYQSTNERQNEAILLLIENVVRMNKSIMLLLDKELQKQNK
ncbi:helix-turn-helix transcriptional regulator [Sphingobacterium sp. DN00404]|uniref:Helix-turn-helix transcriptional regulator n=1 Tax=Sphingobacterium micropteri TaxID=2763501 RepID=A0ABR7YM01_9SPHI|nr:helix-turn-helix transcriptional regulator [Sphingobacterium micropteri]MBD1432355.1 helix-turn-helix transcriptional regulator [Sphingobacterium micropteri]